MNKRFKKILCVLASVSMAAQLGLAAPVSADTTTFYSEDFTNVTDASTVATSTNAQAQLVISTDDTHGNYLAYDFSSTNTNSRGAYMDFTGIDVSEQTSYVVEFDAMITPGNNQQTQFAVKGADFVYTANDKGSPDINYGAGSGYIIKLVNTAGGSTTYTLNGSQTVTIPSATWCSYKLYVDKAQGLVSTTITDASGNVVADKVITAYDGAGNVGGYYFLAGRYYPVEAVDNIVVRSVADDDEFGELAQETLSSLEFTSALNTTIYQPEEGSPVHLPITVKANGIYGNDLTEADGLTIEWSTTGLVNPVGEKSEDGYISLTKEEGTGTGTEGEDPDGATAYFNVRNGVSNWFGSVTATVTYLDDTMTISTPFAVIGAGESSYLAPAAGYPESMDDYASSLVGYAATANGISDQDIVLNNWSIYGSNGSRTLTLNQDDDGTKYLRFASNGGSGSTVGVYQLADQSSQYIVDMTVRFTGSAMAFGHYYNTPNNSNGNSAWSASYGSGTLTVGTESITGLNAEDWFRIVISADESAGTVWAKVYDEDGALVGEVADVALDSTYTEVQKYFCFQGTYPVDLASFKIYYPTAASLEINTDDTIQVPEDSSTTTVDVAAVMKDTDGYNMTGAITWTLEEDYAGVTLESTGTQSATLSVTNEAGAGTIIVRATSGSTISEKEITLSTSGNSMVMTEYSSSLTIPFSGEDAVSATYAAEARTKDGSVIEGTDITYEMVDASGEAVTGVRGVTFDADTATLTVEAGAASKVVYIKATATVDEEVLTTKTKVNIHGLSFAFGSDEPADDSYTQVTSSDAYTAKIGYGFSDTSALTNNAASITSASAYTFKATVPNGNYTVTVDTTSSAMTSEVVESVVATTGISKSGSTFNVAVCDGVLDLTFEADSELATLSITQMAEKTANSKPAVYAIGDSTTSNNSNGALSWGNCVANGLVTVPDTFSSFSNNGMAGRDSVNYYNQGRVETVLLSVCPGDYVTVNMGINSKETGEAASYYTLMSEYYVEGIIQRGGIPVIVTATPQGPVSSYVGNYDSSTGIFTCNRGDGARNDVLRQIASEKGLDIIELGYWGDDLFNSLTLDDVTAYNETYGTEYTTILELVQGWYVDHNHYKEYLGTLIGEYLLSELETIATNLTVTFDTDDHASIDIYYVADEYDTADETDVTKAYVRAKGSSDLDASGEGQVNFLVKLDDGYEIDTIEVTPADGYNKIKGEEETGVANLYRITKISDNLTVTITTKATSTIDDPTEDKATVEVTGTGAATVTLADDVTATIAVATYTADGTLVSVKLTENATGTVNVTAEAADTETVKLYVWDEMEPLCDAADLI